VQRTAADPAPAEPRKRPRRGPKLRETSFDDYEQIARLEARYGLSVHSYEEWSDLWLGNPVYRELQPGWSIGWVLEDEDDRIVGSMENIPLSYEFEGRRILASSGGAWVAESEYRSASLLLLEHVINQPRVDLYVNSTVSASSTAAVGALDCHPVPIGLWNESAFWITRYHGFFESLLTLKGYPLAPALSCPVSAVAWLKDRLGRSALDPGDVAVEGCPDFDERFDDFWTDLTRRNPHLLLAARTREVLAWHYRPALSRRRLWIAAVPNGPRLVAYAVFDRRDKPAIGLKRARLVDFQSLDGGTALLPPLLAWALTRCRDEGIHMLECFGRWLEQGELIASIAPYRRRSDVWTHYYRAHNPRLAERLRNPDAWAPSLFDGDSSLLW
jgi:hypothetical protein